MLNSAAAVEPESSDGWLADLYLSHFGAVFRLCRSMLWDREEAADATQEVFFRAVRRGVPFENDDHARAWLFQVGRNHCIDVMRRRQRLDGALRKANQGALDPQDPESLAISRGTIQAVLAELSPRDRRLLWQSAVERLALEDIAAGLQVGYMTAAQALRRARLRAAAIAARVAAVVILFRPRRMRLPFILGKRALLLALLPALVVGVQSSTPAAPRQPSAPTVISRQIQPVGVSVSTHRIDFPPRAQPRPSQAQPEPGASVPTPATDPVSAVVSSLGAVGSLGSTLARTITNQPVVGAVVRILRREVASLTAPKVELPSPPATPTSLAKLLK